MKTIEELTAKSTKWYSSTNDEVWHGGPYDTKEEALAGALENEHPMICEATHAPIRVSKYFEQGDFLERAEEDLYELSNEDGDPILDFPPEVNLDLERRVRQAIDEWQVAHQLSPTTWIFDSVGPAIKVDLPGPVAD